MDLILVLLGNVKVENSSNSMIRLPDTIVTKMLVCTNDIDVRMPSTSIVAMVKN
jgi:hypothetical protein